LNNAAEVSRAIGWRLESSNGPEKRGIGAAWYLGLKLGGWIASERKPELFVPAFSERSFDDQSIKNMTAKRSASRRYHSPVGGWSRAAAFCRNTVPDSVNHAQRPNNQRFSGCVADDQHEPHVVERGVFRQQHFLELFRQFLDVIKLGIGVAGVGHNLVEIGNLVGEWLTHGSLMGHARTTLPARLLHRKRPLPAFGSRLPCLDHEVSQAVDRRFILANALSFRRVKQITSGAHCGM